MAAGLISNDILRSSQACAAIRAFLTHKGKMLGYFRVYTLSDGLWVEDVGEVGDATFQALRKFLLYGIKAKMENCAESWGLLLISGPKACATVSAAFGVEMSDLKPVSAIAAQIGGHASFVLRTEETGEIDLEVLLPADAISTAWERLMEAGATYGIKAVGGHAREALRIEAGLPKAGADLNEEIVPPEANLEGKAFSLNKGCYPGQEVGEDGYLRQRAAALSRASPEWLDHPTEGRQAIQRRQGNRLGQQCDAITTTQDPYRPGIPTPGLFSPRHQPHH
jgi:folate-binding protein YgfZ